MGEKEKHARRLDLLKKSREGTNNIVKKMLEHPDIQKILLMQSVKSGLMISILFVGMFQVISALKQVYPSGWQVDLGLGLILITVFAVYMFKKNNAG